MFGYCFFIFYDFNCVKNDTTGRVVRKDTDDEESVGGGSQTITFLCIGYDNGKFLDLIIPGARGHLLSNIAVSGTAVTKKVDTESLEVKTIRGVSLRSLFPTSV